MAGPWNAGVISQVRGSANPYNYFPLVQYTSFSNSGTSAGSVYAASSIAASSSGYRILLLNAQLAITAANSNASAMFISSSTTTQNTGLSVVSSTIPMSIPFSPVGLFTTVLNESLAISASSGAMTGIVTYVYI